MAICDNPKCKHHIPMPTQGRSDVVFVWGSITPIGEQEKLMVHRHLYRHLDGLNEFYLCDCCHSAAEIVKCGAA